MSLLAILDLLIRHFFSLGSFFSNIYFQMSGWRSIVWYLYVSRCITSVNCIRLEAFCISIKHMNAGLLYSTNFSIICLMIKMASMQYLPDLNPCCYCIVQKILNSIIHKIVETFISNFYCRFISLVTRGLFSTQKCLFPLSKTACWKSSASSVRIILSKYVDVYWIFEIIYSQKFLIHSESLSSNLCIEMH